MKRVVCNKEVFWQKVKKDFEEILTQADTWGVDSLTENEQVVWEGLCCSHKCFNKLN